MNHSITIGGLLFSVGTIVGLGVTSFGLLMTFAAGMADCADDGTGKKGCITSVVGIILTIGSLIALFT